MSEPTQKEETSAASQAAYRGTPYEDSSWEVVGEFLNSQEFEPVEFNVVSSSELVSDPMFADFGGRSEGDKDKRYHIPTGMSFAAARRLRGDMTEIEDDPNVQKIHKDELQKMLQQAVEQGRAEALAEATLQTNEQIKALEDRYGTIVQDVANQLVEGHRQTEKQALELALSISQKLVGSVVEINPEYVLEIIQQALKQTGGATIRLIKVSPQDLEFIQLLNLPKHFKEFDGTWKFESDDSIRAGCVVITTAGDVDFQLDQAWARVQDQIMRIAGS